MKDIHIAICHYPYASLAAVHGLYEVFDIANRLCHQNGTSRRFKPEIVTEFAKSSALYAVVILPPSTDDRFYAEEQTTLAQWLNHQHDHGAILSSACAGAFLLAQTKAVQSRPLTTHWGLAQAFQHQFPHIKLQSDAILIDHSDIISAGGMMSWLDLALAIVSRFTGESITRQLGKALVIDTAPRRQTYYQQFNPDYQHGDKTMLEIQRKINHQYSGALAVAKLANNANLTVRTFQRRFAKATGLTPIQYIQRVRIQNACDQLETTNKSFKTIADNIGYEDTSACRKVFIKIMGLTPGEFRRRFKRH